MPNLVVFLAVLVLGLVGTWLVRTFLQGAREAKQMRLSGFLWGELDLAPIGCFLCFSLANADSVRVVIEDDKGWVARRFCKGECTYFPNDLRFDTPMECLAHANDENWGVHV